MLHRGMGIDGDFVEDASHLYDTDEEHWDADAAHFWWEQAQLHRIGECNAPIAATELVDYNPAEG